MNTKENIQWNLGMSRKFADTYSSKIIILQKHGELLKMNMTTGFLSKQTFTAKHVGGKFLTLDVSWCHSHLKLKTRWEDGVTIAVKLSVVDEMQCWVGARVLKMELMENIFMAKSCESGVSEGYL